MRAILSDIDWRMLIWPGEKNASPLCGVRSFPHEPEQPRGGVHILRVSRERRATLYEMARVLLSRRFVQTDEKAAATANGVLKTFHAKGLHQWLPRPTQLLSGAFHLRPKAVTVQHMLRVVQTHPQRSPGSGLRRCDLPSFPGRRVSLSQMAGLRGREFLLQTDAEGNPVLLYLFETLRLVAVYSKFQKSASGWRRAEHPVPGRVSPVGVWL